ncbi:hypothetical protein [Desulfococcus multivorans]|uniref:Uncharacterized protein n=1 Tax=Desulfococcus multivorans DSM 2059 TaxID=1121405 RepID=S7TT82_DESML|nr:hypothetical protein [Desulfococcus multivorans]AOY60465.1 uncharacterized protein Dmul_36970 [Desulfococcus multivorans]AQV02558.1 hypothetical protein B2D07_18465 [Desulfococcus multivorans]EPR40257.1 hypothetical protein dsmv_2392 [Desulfococcus multivorans DSM 2059]SJZ62403.1 hypothetical protein SAMN02745446_01162 [Desulfococcus multivorans DSM 2059]
MYQVCVIDFSRTEKLIVVDNFPTLKAAVDDFCAGGWEDRDNVRKQAVLIRDPCGKIHGVGTYVDIDCSSLPVLVWVYAHGAMENRYYEKEYAGFIEKEV